MTQSYPTRNALFILDTQQCNLRLSAHRSHPVGPMAPLKPISFHFTFTQRNHRSCSVVSNLVTLCLSLAFLTGASNFASNHGVVTHLAALNRYVEGLGDKFWLTQSDKFLSDDLFVVPGPVNIRDLTRHTQGVQYKARPLVHGDQLTYAQDLMLRLTKAHEVFSSITKELKQKRKEYYDLNWKFQSFHVGDHVLVKRPPRLNKSDNQLAIKWLPKWDGPYRIVEQVKDSNNYRLEHAYTGKQ